MLAQRAKSNGLSVSCASEMLGIKMIQRQPLRQARRGGSGDADADASPKTGKPQSPLLLYRRWSHPSACSHDVPQDIARLGKLMNRALNSQ